MAQSTGRRDLQKEAFWRRTIDRQRGSGRSVRAWCHRHGLSEANFHWWRRELARRDSEERASSFVPVRVAGAPAEDNDCRLEIVLTDERRVLIAGPVNRRMLSDVLEVLATTALQDPDPSRSFQAGSSSC